MKVKYSWSTDIDKVDLKNYCTKKIAAAPVALLATEDNYALNSHIACFNSAGTLEPLNTIANSVLDLQGIIKIK